MRISDWSSDVCSSDLRPDDPCEPDSRPDALEDQIARDLEDAIAEEEERRPQPIGGFAKPKVPDHLELRIGDILPVDIGDEVEQAEERHQPPCYAPHDRTSVV